MAFSINIKTWIGFKPSQQDLMQCYIETNDPKYLEQLVKMHQNCLYKYFCLQHGQTLAADICQQTWLKVIEKRHLYQSKQQFKAWLFAVARNVYIDHYRANKKWSDCESVDNIDDSIFLTHQDENNASQVVDLNAALKQLPYEQRECLELQLNDFSLAEIATITHTDQETVKSRIRYAKQKLKHLLNFQDISA